MKSFLLLLVLSGLATHSLQGQSCVAGTTRDSGCSQCATDAPDSDCEYCQRGYWKSGAKACTACPDGSGRDLPTAAIMGVETNAVCTIKSSPQLKCKLADSPDECLTCAAGSFRERVLLHGEERIGVGCSTDCKSFDYRGIQKLLPAAQTPAAESCTTCGSLTGGCVKCEYAPTMRRSAFSVVGDDKQLTKCTECASGLYLKANSDATIVPFCDKCGANCKKCKDIAMCETCYPGWALDGTDKANCLKAVSISGNILTATLISILAVFIAW